VELVLESFPDVKEAHVVGLPDDVRGEIVTAAVVSCEGASVDTDALLAHARAELASFKVPRHIFVMKKSELPETSTGKIQKGRLRELLRKGR
jgi:fatty-acyl-CoA synthase